ncbi:hypothetical protein LP316_00595 [Thalassotalea sp. LPB0316]|uniref:hypothetical protein n=1 Tax=Thalassotalea sp. LPB0316 TaxID=2769490 RepID=UPI0018673C58|nr:hypothetical protein [Thalassotalea sp. LPB0316]QOL25853.1 hypothetical protein LP316_00595 [Thalassotalea sp. LPB0316]
MRLKTSFIALASAVALFSCGGGSSSSSTTNNNNNSGQSSNNKTFRIQAVYEDSCGNESPVTQASLIIHGSDFSNEQIISANANGVMTYSTSASTRDVSIVMPDIIEVAGVNPIEVVTTLEQPMVDAGKIRYYTSDSSQCECRTLNFDAVASARASDYPIFGALGGVDGYSSSSNLGQYNYTQVSQCKPISGNYGAISSMISFDNPDEAFGAFMPSASTDYFVVDQTLVGSQVSINTDEANSKQAATYTGRDSHFRNYAFGYDDTPLYAFDHDDADYYRVTAYNFEDIYGIEGVDRADVFYLNAMNSEDINQTFDLPLTAIDYMELAQLLNGDQPNYDLSHYSGFDFISMTVSARSANGRLFDWYMRAPTSGQLPSIENLDTNAFIPDSTVESLIDTVNFRIGIYGYQGISSYNDYLAKLSTNDGSPATRVSSDWNNYFGSRLSLTMSNVDLSPLKPLASVVKVKYNQPLVSKPSNNRALN